MRIAWRILLCGLIGMIVFAFMAAQVVFEAREAFGFSSVVAGSIAGQMLHRLNLATLVVLLALIALESGMRRSASLPTAGMWIMALLAGMLALTLAEMVAIAPSIAGMRQEILRDFGGMENAPEEARRRFGMLHGASMARGVAVAAMGLAAVLVDGFAGTSRRERARR